MDGLTATHALTSDTMRPGALAHLLEVAKTEAIYPPTGRILLGSWTTEFGELNQLHRLWKISQEAQTCESLARPEGLQHRTERVLQERRPTLSKNSGPFIYEMRYYQLKPGLVEDFLELLLAHFELRETWSKAVGVWVPHNGEINEVIHIWYYRDLVHRAQTRSASASDPVWEAYRQKVLPMLTNQRSVLLSPTAFSPMK